MGTTTTFFIRFAVAVSLSLVLLSVGRATAVQGQTPKPRSINLVAFPNPDVMFTYDLNEDPWLLQVASWAIDLPADGSCIVGADGTGFALKSLDYVNYAEYDEEDGVITSVEATSSQPIWVAGIQANCNNNPAIPTACTFLFTSLSTDGTEGSWCGSYYAFRLVNRECALTHYQSDQFTDSPLVIEWEYLPLIQALDADLKSASLTVDVHHSVRRVGQLLKGVGYAPAGHSAHFVGHAFDFGLACSTCSAKGGPATCNKLCLRKIYRGLTSTPPTPAAFTSFMKGGSHVGSPGHPGPIRWGASFGDWFHLDDNNYYYSGSAAQQTTYTHTWLRVQSQLQLMCGGGMCVAPQGQPQLSLSDLQSTICSGIGVLSVKTTITPPSSTTTASNLDDADDSGEAQDEANDALAALVAQGVLSSTTTMVNSLMKGSSVGADRLWKLPRDKITAQRGWAPTGLQGSNPSTLYNLTGPVYQPASALVGLTLDDLSEFTVTNSTAGSWTITFSAPDTLSNFLTEAQQLLLAPHSTSAAAALLNYTTSINLTSSANAATMLKTNALVNLSSTWNASLIANNLTASAFSINASYPDGSGLAPLLLLQLPSNGSLTVPFFYQANGSLYSSTIVGNLTFNVTSLVSAYAFLASCYPLLGINATRVTVSGPQQLQQPANSTAFLGSSQRIVAAAAPPSTFSYTAMPDECLYLLPGQQSPISAGGLNLTLDRNWTDPFGRVTKHLGLLFMANGSSPSVQERNAATSVTANRSLGAWPEVLLTMQGVVLFNQSTGASSTPMPNVNGADHSHDSHTAIVRCSFVFAVAVLTLTLTL